MYEFNELLPHHIRFVQRCYRGFQHFYEARADTGLLEYVQGYDKRASLPCELTCQKILEVRPPPLEACPPCPPLLPPWKPARWIALCSLLFRPPLPPDVH